MVAHLAYEPQYLFQSKSGDLFSSMSVHAKVVIYITMSVLTQSVYDSACVPNIYESASYQSLTPLAGLNYWVFVQTPLHCVLVIMGTVFLPVSLRLSWLLENIPVGDVRVVV